MPLSEHTGNHGVHCWSCMAVMRENVRYYRWERFWGQIALASLMTYMQRVGHDWHECSDAGGPVADSLPCLDCGAGT